MTSTEATLPVESSRRGGWRSAIAFLSRPIVFGAYIPTIALLNAFVGVALPMVMTPMQFGEYALAVTLFQYGLIFDCGSAQLIDRWIPPALEIGRLDEVERLSQSLLWVRLYIGLFLFAAAAAALAALSSRNMLPFSLTEGILSAGAGILYMVALGPGNIYRAVSARRNYAFAMGTLSLGLFIARPLGIITGGLVGCFSALTVWYFAFAIFFNLKMPPKLAARPSPRQALRLVAMGLPFFATSFVWAFYLTANRWFASQDLNIQIFGHFAFSANVFSLLVGVLGGFSAFYYPTIVGRIAQGKPFAQSRRIMIDFSKLLLALGAVVAIGIALATPLLANIYPQYSQSVSSVRILLAAVPVAVLASWLMPISLSAGRRPWIDGLIVYPIATAILFGAMRVLAARFEDIGAAAASIISALPLVLMLLLQLRFTHILKTSALVLLMALTTAMTVGLLTLAWLIK